MTRKRRSGGSFEAKMAGGVFRDLVYIEENSVSVLCCAALIAIAAAAAAAAAAVLSLCACAYCFL